jgi:hypothetical protein
VYNAAPLGPTRRGADPSSGRRLRLRRRNIAPVFPFPVASRPNAATSRGAKPRPKPTSELVDEKRQFFVKQEETELEEAVHDLCDASVQTLGHSDLQEFSSRGSSPTIDSRAPSEEGDQPRLGQEFHLGLLALRSIVEFTAASGGACSRQGSAPKPLNQQQVQSIHDQLLLIESTANNLRQIISTHFSPPVQNDAPTDNPTCGPSPATLPQTQSPTDADLIAVLGFDWTYNSDPALDLGAPDDVWNSMQPASCTPHAGPSGCNSDHSQLHFRLQLCASLITLPLQLLRDLR